APVSGGTVVRIDDLKAASGTFDSSGADSRTAVDRRRRSDDQRRYARRGECIAARPGDLARLPAVWDDPAPDNPRTGRRWLASPGIGLRVRAPARSGCAVGLCG